MVASDILLDLYLLVELYSSPQRHEADSGGLFEIPGLHLQLAWEEAACYPTGNNVSSAL
jgi:hypothetical protein